MLPTPPPGVKALQRGLAIVVLHLSTPHTGRQVLSQLLKLGSLWKTQCSHEADSRHKDTPADTLAHTHRAHSEAQLNTGRTFLGFTKQ